MIKNIQTTSNNFILIFLQHTTYCLLLETFQERTMANPLLKHARVKSRNCIQISQAMGTRSVMRITAMHAQLTIC